MQGKLGERVGTDPSLVDEPQHGVARPAEFADAYFDASRSGAIYFNLTFAVLLIVIAPVRHFIFGLPLFPTSLSMALEWGVMVPACLATAYFRVARASRQRVGRLTALLIAMGFAALLWDTAIWDSVGIPIPHEYSGLYFIAAVSVAGVSSRLALALSGLFLVFCVVSLVAPGTWEPTTGGFKLYFDLVAIGFTLLNTRSLRAEAGVSWELNERLTTTVRLIAERRAQEREIQQRHEAAIQASEERFRAVVESAPTAMVMIDSEGTIALVNSQAENLFGYPREAMLERKVDMLVPTSIRSHHASLRQGFFTDPRPRTMGIGRDLFGVRMDGTEFPVEIGLNPIRTSEGNFVLAAIADITERHRAQQALTDLNRTLETQVGETRAAFSRLKETQNQLVQAEKLASLGGLVAGVAHEINTPIGIGVTAASHLQDEVHRLATALAGGKLTKSQLQSSIDGAEQASAMVLSNLKRASDLIGSFKRVAVDQATEDLRSIGLRDYIDEVLTSLRPQLKSKAHRIEVLCDPSLRAELVPGALAQILTNLVMNSLIHAFGSGDSGLIRIQAEAIGEEILLRFSDDGTGISSEALPRIFDPFFTTRRGSGGTGLGLHVVFNLVHQTLGGTIQADSCPEGGAEFLIRFPVNRGLPVPPLPEA